MLKGKLYEITLRTFVFDQQPEGEWNTRRGFLGCIEPGDIVMYLEQSRTRPYQHRVSHKDYFGWVALKNHNFKEIDLAEPEKPS